MLTGDLVRVRIRKGVLYPPYINTADPDLLSLAETLIGVFNRHVGNSRQELDEELTDLLGSGTAFLVHRGLGKLLMDRCEFETPGEVDPSLLRETVFTAAAAAYRSPEQARFDRSAILAASSQELGLTAEDMEHGLYADLKEAAQLQIFKTCSPEWLLKRYNVALAQAILLRATSVDLVIENQTTLRYRELFRKLKFFQLLHDVRSVAPGKYHIHIDGPLSLFKSSQRYGLQMAQFLPAVLHCDTWRLTASALWGIDRREAVFQLSPTTGLEPIGHSAGQWAPEEIAWLGDQFRKLDTDWEVSEEGEIVHLGGQGILSPDYVFTHRPTGMTVYMEIMGFWRRGAAQSRLDLLRRHGPANMIVGLSKDLGVDEEEAADLPGEVYLFRNTPIAREVHKILETMRVKAG